MTWFQHRPAWLDRSQDKLFLPGHGHGHGHGQVTLRGLNGPDRQLYCDHLLRLSGDDRHARFHSAMSDEAIRRHAARMDWHRCYAFGAFVQGKLRAVAESVPETDGEAELAISVEREWQHEGLGKLLVVAVVLVARRLGLRALHINYLPGNESMRALARDVGARIIPGAQPGSVVVHLAPKTTRAAVPTRLAPETGCVDNAGP